MNCTFEDNSPRVLESPIEVRCIVCNRIMNVRVFPVHATCEGSDFAEFVDHVESSRAVKIVGLGDVVAKAIDTLTFGLIHKAAGCGCDQRQEWLNSLLSWKSTTNEST
jgi:hypothetical protein